MTNWIFQLNPERFSIAASDEADRPRRFNVARYRDQLHPGDGAAIWVSGPRAGVYGFAMIAANEAGALDIYEDEIQSDSGWLRAEDVGRRLWVVNFRDDARWLDQPILRSILKADPRFEDALILKMPGGGNPFPVTDEQWRAIISRRSD
jgi:predicted RNA-binding protein with PUA-like domain